MWVTCLELQIPRPSLLDQPQFIEGYIWKRIHNLISKHGKENLEQVFLKLVRQNEN